MKPIWRVLGPERAKAWPTLYAFSGADNTGRFPRIGNATRLQVYLKADGDVVKALQMLSSVTVITERDKLPPTSMGVRSSPGGRGRSRGKI